jgi:uncharacterized protein
MPSRRSYIPGDFTLTPKRSSAGIGLFTQSQIPKNSCVIEYVGRVLDDGEDEKSKSLYLFKVNSKVTLDGKPKINKAGYINHSCKPNCESVIHNKRVYIFSKRKVFEGEELTYDYGKEYCKEHCTPCKCAHCTARQPMTTPD